MCIQIDMAIDAVCVGVPSFEEFSCLLGVSHGDHFGCVPIEAVVTVHGVRIHEGQGIASADGQFMFVMRVQSFRPVWPTAYVGHTGRKLWTRINEHKLAIRRRDPLSLVFAHAVDCDHHFNWDATEVFAMANTKQAREFLEAWHSNTNSINRHVDLDAHYEGLRARLTDSRRPYTNNSLSMFDQVEFHGCGILPPPTPEA
ncbi:unnamed protein product [Schistocephalus solidus]|uniref:LRAT domain-containing protein n=1 Tax=Schistocephalus solidus TaxID=70667 RepID=A0A183THF2_SCHSO|nr:unnamed protein product [Schistocephalus solidus]